MNNHQHNGAGAGPEPDAPTVEQLYQDAIMAAMPGLTGAIDQSLREQMGHPVAFVLLTFGPGAAVFTSNIPDGDEMRRALRATVADMPPPEVPQ